jgi:hypothetical protein
MGRSASPASPTTLLEALDRPDLFQTCFPSPAWDRWRAFCRALYGLPMPAGELATFRACTGRRDAPSRPATEAWVICGRRSGKSRIASAIAAYVAALAPTDRLVPGETGVVLIVAVDRQQATIILNYVKALFELPALRGLVVGETADSLELRHRVTIQVRAGSYRGVRGLTLLAAILDEVAYLRDESSALPDVELFRALKPALATTDGLILGISSPWAQRGLLFSKYKKHYSHDGDVLIWQADSRTMHPGLSAQLVAEAFEDDPEAAAAEWAGVFRSDLESYISTAVLEGCTTPQVIRRPPVSGVAYCGFVDVASGSGRDAFTAAVAHGEPLEDGQVVAVLDAVFEAAPPFDALAVVAEAAEFLRGYGCTVAQADKYAAGFVVEAFRRAGITVTQDAAPKSDLYLQALPLFTSARVDLLDLPKLRSQLASLERRRRAGGRDVVDHLPGAHDDVANAAAGALVLAAQRGAGDAGLLVCEREPSDLLATMIHEFGPIEPYFRE